MSRRAAQIGGEIKAAFARHHDVQNHPVELDAPHQRRACAASAATVTRKPLAGQIALQQAAQPLVVIDHKQVRGSGTVHRRMDMGGAYSVRHQ